MLNSFRTRFNMVLSNGVDTDTYYPENRIVNDKLKVFFVASLTKRKGLDILLPLIDRFENNSDIEFYVAGGGPLEGEVKKRKNITYLGVLDEKELASEYRKCDLFVYPSHDDFYGLVVLEALSSGLYVLCGEFLKGNFDDFEGRYLEYIKMNVHSFYLRIVNIMNDRSIIMHSKEDEYDYVKSNYDWKVVSSTFYQEMRRLYKQFQKEVLHTQ
jgi:glycosyltransferase involved in cell wall biosynthesis